FMPTSTSVIYTLSLHDALPICAEDRRTQNAVEMLIGVRVIAQNQLLGGATESLANVGIESALPIAVAERRRRGSDGELMRNEVVDRKSTRLNSSHDQISYAVFC